MNIAFEISPLITASGTFGDKSGVYRYTFGLLNSLIDEATNRDEKNIIYLFTFSPSLLSHSLNPDVLALTKRKNVILVGYEKKLHLSHTKENDWIEYFNIPYFKFLLKIVDKIFHIREIYGKWSEKKIFKAYIKTLENTFKENDIKVVVHSETGFFPMKGVKNAITVYDLTTVLIPSLHREATVDLQTRKLRFAKKYCDGIIAISNSTKDDLEAYSDKYLRKKIIVAYPGLDPTFETNTELTVENLNKMLKQFNNTVESKKYFLYYGTFEPRKNISYVVRAFSELLTNKQIPSDFKLVMVGGKGWGLVRERVEDFIRENYPHKENSPFILLDYVHDKYLTSLIKNAYAVVYPSLYEGFGLPVLESMAVGTPVICSDTSSLPEVGGDAVLYINPKDFEDVKEKMAYLVKKPEAAKVLSKKSLKQSSKFTWKTSARDIYSFFETL